MINFFVRSYNGGSILSTSNTSTTRYHAGVEYGLRNLVIELVGVGKLNKGNLVLRFKIGSS